MTDLPYRAIWERELRAGMSGQNRQRHSTWKMDGLYRAVCWQARAEDLEQIIATSLANEAHPDSIAKLLRNLEHDKKMAHRVFVEWEKAHGANTAA